MSFNIRNIREISNAPLTKFVNQLAKKLAKSIVERQTEKLENKEDIYSVGQDIETVLRFNTLGSTTYFDGSKEYYPTFEPDGEIVTCWIKGINVGNTTRDLSGFDNEISILGDPLLIDGAPFDLGIMAGGVKSTAVKFNRPGSTFENQESIRIAHHTRLGIDGIGTGISYFIRFRAHSMAQQGGSDRRLFEKHDTTDPITGESIMVILTSSNNRLSVQFNRSGSPFEKLTPINSILPNVVYDVWITYNQSGGALKVYINGVDQTLTDGGAAFGYHSDSSNLDLSIMHSGGNDTNRFVYGDLYDFMIYREKVVSSTEVSRHFTNKWTIFNNPFGQNMISNYWATPFGAAQAAYTTAGYTTIAYNT